MQTALFGDRREAGRRLADRFRTVGALTDPVVLGLPRGGIPVAFEVANALGAPLDVCVVRKLGVPGHEELAMGAIASGGVQLLDTQLIRALQIPRSQVERTVAREELEHDRRERAYRSGRPTMEVRGRTVILVDDGLATGASMAAAVTALRQREPRAIVVAVPVASRSACAALEGIANGCVCVATPEPFHGGGEWYADFEQTTDDEVRELLATANSRAASAPVSRAVLTR
jgi:predicted phosphoribosyltransferase